MKKQLLVLCILFTAIQGYAQYKFEKGYFINNSGEKIECLIKNMDWKNNPSEFRYKLTDQDIEQTNNIDEVAEFAVHSEFKYERHSVLIDRSPDSMKNMSTEKDPIFTEEQLFLKVLIEGKANLYYYESANLRRFFFKTQDSEIEQLVYKRYRTANSENAYNNKFRQQLYVSLKCDKISVQKIENLGYRKSDLVSVFELFNQCEKVEYEAFKKISTENLIHITLRPGIKSSSLAIKNNGYPLNNTDFGNEISFRLGVEFEYILPFNKNKFALIFEPGYQYFSSEKEITYTKTLTFSETTVVTSDYSSVELPIGFRYYSFINDNSKLFFDAQIVIGIPLSKTIQAERPELIYLETRTSNNLAFSVGYNYAKKYSVALQYQTNRNLFVAYNYWNSDYKSIALIFGYTLF
jgi:hypothetical protein